MKQPELGWTTPVEISKVTDGDTIKILVTREIEIRLTDIEGTFDAPETWRPKSEEERIEGQKYTDRLKEIVEEGTDFVLHIPTGKRGRLKDIFCIGTRAVGMLFVDGVDVVEELKKLDEHENTE